MPDQNTKGRTSYDISIIRPQMHSEDFEMRGWDMEPAILKTGIWVESKAVQHYAELLDTIDWDEDTRRIIEKDQADEDGHISRWKTLLESEVSQ